MASISDYEKLVTSEHRGQPNFIATLDALVETLVATGEAAGLLSEEFDIDEAVGVQLDIIGLWVGASRFLGNALPAVYFTWGSSTLGWSQGVWKRASDPVDGLTVLDDEHYRLYLKARIALNNWDGTITGLYQAWADLFFSPAFQILIQDSRPSAVPYFTWAGNDANGWGYGGWDSGNRDAFQARGGMSMVYALINLFDLSDIDAVVQRLFVKGYLTLKPAGVMVEYYVTQSVAQAPIFAWGVGPSSGPATAPPTMLAGWGIGAWGTMSPGT